MWAILFATEMMSQNTVRSMLLCIPIRWYVKFEVHSGRIYDVVSRFLACLNRPCIRLQAESIRDLGRIFALPSLIMYFLIVLTVRYWLQENTIPVEFSHLCAGIVLECDGKIDPTKSPYIPKNSCPGNPPVPVAWYLSTIQIFQPSLIRTPSANGSNMVQCRGF